MARARGRFDRTWPAGMLVAVLCAGVAGSSPPQAEQIPAPAATALGDAEAERFLETAKIVRTRSTPKGVTGSTRATLSDGTLTHDAHIQIVNEERREFRTATGVEWNFRDSWTFNVAAYKLDRLIGLHMVPVSVARRYRSNQAAFTWWVDDVMMDEGARLKKKIEPPPDKVRVWNQQLYLMRVFDQLIYNTDRNMGNMLIGSDWRLWAIDHTRAFRTHKTLKTPSHVSHCDRTVFERMKALTLDDLKREIGMHLDEPQMRAILARRDLIVERLEGLGPARIFERERFPATTSYLRGSVLTAGRETATSSGR